MSPLVLLGALALAEEAETTPDALAPRPSTFTFDTSFATANVRRGRDLYGEDDRAGMHALFAPSLTFDVPEAGLAVTWWGGFPISGDNQGKLVTSGVGAEQDLVVTYTVPVAGGLSITSTMTGYLYPFAAPELTGTPMPLYLEPGVTFGWSGAVDLDLTVAYFVGVQDPIGRDPYAYVRPSIGRGFLLPARLTLWVYGGVGIKGYGAGGPTDNLVDLAADLWVQRDFEGGLFLRPGAHWVWTDNEDHTLDRAAFGWFGLTAGVTL